VRVDVLERAGELVVKSLNEGYDAAGNAEDLAGFDVGQLLVVFPLLGVLDDDNLIAVLENLEELAELLVGPVWLLVPCSRKVLQNTHSFHWSWCMWLAVPEVMSKRVEMRVNRTRILW
jgi:hypothetical protein